MFQFFQNSKFKLHILCETSLRDPTIEGREGGRGVPNPSSSLNLTQIPVPSLTVVQIPVTKSKIPNLIPVLMQSFPSSQCSHSHFPSPKKAKVPVFVLPLHDPHYCINSQTGSWALSPVTRVNDRRC